MIQKDRIDTKIAEIKFLLNGSGPAPGVQSDGPGRPSVGGGAIYSIMIGTGYPDSMGAYPSFGNWVPLSTLRRASTADGHLGETHRLLH